MNLTACLQSLVCHLNIIGSGYGYGTVPGGRWAIDTEGGHVVVSVSLIRNGYEYVEYLYRRVATTHDLNAILYPPSSENTVRCIAV